MTSLVSLAITRKPGLKSGETVPRIERSASFDVSGAVDAYAHICGAPAPVQRGALPLLWPAVLAAPLHMEIFADRAFPLKAMGMVHVRNRVTWTGAVERLDQPVDLVSWVQGHRPHHRGVEIDLVTEIAGSNGALWRETKTILCPGESTAVRPERKAPESFGPTRSTYWSLPSDLGRRYARIAGDLNPIHQYTWAAKLFGFKRHLIHGMWSLARAISEMDAELPVRGTLEVSFIRPIFLPCRVLFESGPLGDSVAFSARSPHSAKPHFFGRVVGG